LTNQNQLLKANYKFFTHAIAQGCYNLCMTKTAKTLLPYENKWVALNKKGDKVLASAKDVNVLSTKLDAMKIQKGDAILTWVYPFKQSFAPVNV
jgi:hypothetical protein